MFRRNRRDGCFGTVATRYYRSTPLEKAQAWLRLFAQRATNHPKILPFPIAPLLDGKAERIDFAIADIPAEDIASAIRDVPSCELGSVVSNTGSVA
ncbi:hypothetical protein [Sphingobium scionense]|uniref:hypothetical protein n=1 Tax=Sphingobium scionense TaxID=1404341 RepID=UPI001CB6E674|nr:hypothetical protein [Sphingobium scionense]